ncbi:MAG TPA: FG-GAP-like repeat-containing protein [Clostridiales bacterium]|nr:FG-GAP-like repeat-containing protein [Clostridiales bacterium]HQP69220.1 FG-GAP-like repeat-containing protein [Clostridiales bacterium]
MKSAILSLLVLSGILLSQSFTEINAGFTGVNRSSAAWGDFDNDDDIDILISGDFKTDIYRNDNGFFTSINAGLIRVGYGAVGWGDYDNDGDLDILISGWNGSYSEAKIYRNTNGIFSDINAGLPGILHGFSNWVDYDNDGDLDVFLTGTDKSQNISRLYRNDSGTFINSDISFPGLIYSWSDWDDFDNDGYMDLLLTGNTGSGRISNIYKNNGGSFTLLSSSLPAVESGPVDWGDYDGDGDLDVLLSGWSGSEVITDVYRNDNGSFVCLSTGMTKMYGGCVTWGDCDNDGDLDALMNGYSAVGFYCKLYVNNNGIFSELPAAFTGTRWGWSIFGDYDKDGDKDFILTGGTASGQFIAKLYRNDLALIPTVPDPPVCIAATNVNGSQFQANWKPSDSADGYFLDVASDSTFTDYVSDFQNKDVGNVTNCIVTGIESEKMYYYRSRAYNEQGTSGNGNTIKVITFEDGSYIYGPYVYGIWPKSNSPYYVCGDITIPDKEVLSIEAGCEIIFQGHYRINVQGCLEAVGMENDSIIFRAADAETGWMGIRFINTPDGNPKSLIGYCTIKNGNANLSGSECYGGGISVENYSKIDIFNNLFTNNRASAGSAINCNNNAGPNILDNTFTYNRAGYETGSGYGTINCMFYSAPTIDGNVFENNWLIGENYCAGAAIRCVFDSSPFIKNNIINGNWIESNGNLAEGTAMYIHSSDPIIMNNLIYDNYIYPESGHGSGGAIFFYDSYAKLINNTIKTNSAREGGALWFKLSCPDFHNNIIRGNQAAAVEQQIFFDDDESDPNFYHNNIEGGKENFGFKYPEYTFTGAWVNNFDEDPGYVNNGNGLDYNLAAGSPCIDAGTLDFTSLVPVEQFDLMNNDRIFGTTIDVGALESDIPSSIDSEIPSQFVLSQNYPNPFNPETTIEFTLPKEQNIELSVYNLKGDKLIQLVNSKMEAGVHEVKFKADDLSSGVYIYLIRSKEFSAQKKMLLIK